MFLVFFVKKTERMPGHHTVNQKMYAWLSSSFLISIREICIKEEGSGESYEVRFIYYDSIICYSRSGHRQRIDSPIAID